MAEISIEKQICESCGANVRSGALFCYNCGGAVSSLPNKIDNKNGNGANNDDFKGKSVVRTKLKEKDKKIEVRAPQEMSEIEVVGERRNDKTLLQPEANLQPEAKLKSAAAMRRKPKTFRKKEVEIVWEEQENPSSLLLIATALLLAIFAAAVIILAMTMK